MTAAAAGKVAVAEEDPLLRAFEDKYDAQVYKWARRRFERDLARHNLTRERCAREICPSSAREFSPLSKGPVVEAHLLGGK